MTWIACFACFSAGIYIGVLYNRAERRELRELKRKHANLRESVVFLLNRLKRRSRESRKESQHREV